MKSFFPLLIGLALCGCEIQDVPGESPPTVSEKPAVQARPMNKGPFVVIQDRAIFFKENAARILTPRSTLPSGTIVFVHQKQGVWADVMLPSGINGTLIFERLRKAGNTDIRAFNSLLASPARKPTYIESTPLPPDLPVQGGTREELEALLLPPLN